jgi:hypothetical protein
VSPPDGRWGGEFSDGVDPTACRGMAGSLDAADECSHGRLPGDPLPACGCWVENRPRVVRSVWPRDRVLSEIRVRVGVLGRVPLQEEWRAAGWAPSVATIQRVCGSWSDGVEAAGFPRPARGRRVAA